MRPRPAIAAIFASVVLLIVVAGFTTHWGWLPPLGRWVDSFVKSPGFGALAAVAAAAVAFRPATRRIEHDRAIEDDHRADALVSATQQRVDA